MVRAYPYLLLPHLLSSRNRAQRRERGDFSRGLLFGGVGVVVCAVLYQGSFWLTGHLAGLRRARRLPAAHGLSWLFLTFLSFLAFSGVVTALSTFFLADDLRLLLVAPVATRRLFHARFLRTVVQASWMVVVFLVPVLIGVGRAKCAAWSFYRDRAADRRAVLDHPGRRRHRRDAGAGQHLSGEARARHPDADGAAVRRQPGHRAALHPAGAAAEGRVAARSHRLLRDAAVADHAVAAVVLGGRNAVREPAGRTRPAARRRRCGRRRWGRWCVLRAASERWYFSGFSRSQEAPKARFTQFRALDAAGRRAAAVARSGGSCWSRI